MTEPVNKGVPKELIGVRVPPQIKAELNRLRKRMGSGKRLSPFCEDILIDYVTRAKSGRLAQEER